MVGEAKAVEWNEGGNRVGTTWKREEIIVYCKSKKESTKGFYSN